MDTQLLLCVTRTTPSTSVRAPPRARTGLWTASSAHRGQRGTTRSRRAATTWCGSPCSLSCVSPSTCPRCGTGPMPGLRLPQHAVGVGRHCAEQLPLHAPGLHHMPHLQHSRAALLRWSSPRTQSCRPGLPPGVEQACQRNRPQPRRDLHEAGRGPDPPRTAPCNG